MGYKMGPCNMDNYGRKAHWMPNPSVSFTTKIATHPMVIHIYTIFHAKKWNFVEAFSHDRVIFLIGFAVQVY